MKPIRTFYVKPSLPAALERLRDLAYNLRWSWNHATIELFRRLDRDLWEATGNNPVLLLARIDHDKLLQAADDDAFLNHLDGVSRALDDYMRAASTWYSRNHGPAIAPRYAYFSAEFAITNCLPIFSGGLGVLAGDHLKSASDLGVPLVGVGLLYQMGYFRQYLNEAGWQQERYEENIFPLLPLIMERDQHHRPLMIEVPLADRVLHAQIWRAQVGRVPLYLLDTNHAANLPSDCDITDQLYGGDNEMRIQQEIVLGVGGMRMLDRLGIHPLVCHMNEGHSAFLALERIRQIMERDGVAFDVAKEAAVAGQVFTTHTAVPAGHDAFPAELVDKYLFPYANALGVSKSESLSMPVLALKNSAHVNAVSRLHGDVSRSMWRAYYPGVPQSEVPVSHITNGVHFCSWISQEMSQLYDRYLGPAWREEANRESIWQRARSIPGEELWRTHERRRERLVVFARGKLHLEEVLNPSALTIGFARRFATYKRATLLFSDPDRLLRILSAQGRPVQIIVSGKAHPRDDPGKRFIQNVAEFARDPQFREHVVFLEDYDLTCARYLVQGADVWLNTPRRPLEASGTSGMKAMANGVLNLSVLDGWWAEAWEDGGGANGTGGWAIGRGEAYNSEMEQDAIEADALYRILEAEVVPAFYERSSAGLPYRWVERMKTSLAELCPVFNTHRMVQEYTDRFYASAARSYEALTTDNFRVARDLAAWRSHITSEWREVKVRSVDANVDDEVQAGTEVSVSCRISLGSLQPYDVSVELCVGRVDSNGDIAEPVVYAMQCEESTNGEFCYRAALQAASSGRVGMSVRVLPAHADATRYSIPPLIAWA